MEPSITRTMAGVADVETVLHAEQVTAHLPRTLLTEPAPAATGDLHLQTPANLLVILLSSWRLGLRPPCVYSDSRHGQSEAFRVEKDVDRSGQEEGPLDCPERPYPRCAWSVVHASSDTSSSMRSAMALSVLLRSLASVLNRVAVAGSTHAGMGRTPFSQCRKSIRSTPT